MTEFEKLVIDRISEIRIKIDEMEMRSKLHPLKKKKIIRELLEILAWNQEVLLKISSRERVH